jgi:hypothetical protein
MESLFASIVRKDSKRNHNLYFFHAALFAYCFNLAERPIMEAHGFKISQDLILHFKNGRIFMP